jgi:hypothetical protein
MANGANTYTSPTAIFNISDITREVFKLWMSKKWFNIFLMTGSKIIEHPDFLNP